MSYTCTSCRTTAVPDSRSLAVDQVGPKWWSPPSVDQAQAEIVFKLWRKGYCDNHAAMFGALAALAIRTEAARRCVLPGTVDVRYVEIDRDPYETLTALEWRAQGEPIIDRVRGFVAGSMLSSVIEVDLDRRRARVTFRLSDGADDVVSTVIETPRLVHLTAQELAAALRDRRSPARAR